MTLAEVSLNCLLRGRARNCGCASVRLAADCVHGDPSADCVSSVGANIAKYGSTCVGVQQGQSRSTNETQGTLLDVEGTLFRERVTLLNGGDTLVFLVHTVSSTGGRSSDLKTEAYAVD